LETSDFAPFKALADLPAAMTAHVLYEDIDATQPATTSMTVIQDVIRRQIGFGGLLMSDDLSMKALAGNMAERTRRALAAGCDVALHCNGNLSEMQTVAAACGRLTDEARFRVAGCLALLGGYQPFDRPAAIATLQSLQKFA
jgi:beta-N-acetylhexosaminidase